MSRRMAINKGSPARAQARQPKLAQRLQHQKAGFLALLLCLEQQALVQEGGDSFQHIKRLIAPGIADGSGGLQCEPPAKMESHRKRRCSSALNRP